MAKIIIIILFIYLLLNYVSKVVLYIQKKFIKVLYNAKIFFVVTGGILGIEKKFQL